MNRGGILLFHYSFFLKISIFFQLPTTRYNTNKDHANRRILPDNTTFQLLLSVKILEITAFFFFVIKVA